MLLTFIDETSDSKFKDYFGLSCALVNSNFYSQIKKEFHGIFKQAGWRPEIEFKGSCLFSATTGCLNVTVDQRIEIASRILALNISIKNARMKFGYFHKKTKNPKHDYLIYLPRVLDRLLGRASRKGGKDLISIHCDRRSDITSCEILHAVKDVLTRKGYVLYENIVQATSSFESVGILYADIVGYLFARIDTIRNDSELFDNIPREEFENNGKIRKLKSSIELIKLIKRFNVFVENEIRDARHN